MSINVNISGKQKYTPRLNLLENKFFQKENKKKSLVNADKTVNYINSKNLDILKIPKFHYFRNKNNNLKHNHNKLGNNPPLSFDVKDDEEKKKLINEINKSFNKLKLQDKERKKYQNLYSNIKDQNKINQYIIQHMMKDKKEKEEIKENSQDNDNKEKDNEKFKDVNNSKTEIDIIVTGFDSEKKKFEATSDLKNDKNELNSNLDSDKKDFFLTKMLLPRNPNKTNIFSRTVRDNIMKIDLFSHWFNKKNNLLNNIKGKKRKSQINFLRKELKYYNKEIDKDNIKLEN